MMNTLKEHFFIFESVERHECSCAEKMFEEISISEASDQAIGQDRSRPLGLIVENDPQERHV